MDADAYIDRTLAAGEVPETAISRNRLCWLCGGWWHGLPDSEGCPGVFASPDQELAYIEKCKARTEAHRSIAKSGTAFPRG